LVSRGAKRVLVQVEAAGDPGDWDFVLSLGSLQIWSPSAQCWTHAEEGDVLTAISQAVQLQDSKLQVFLKDVSALISPEDSTTLANIEVLLTSSLLSERSNVHKSPYLDHVVQILWAADAIRHIAEHEEIPLEVFTFQEWIRDWMNELQTSQIVEIRLAQETPIKQSGFPRFSASRVWKKKIRAYSYLAKALAWLCLRFFSRFTFGSGSKVDIHAGSDTLLLDYFFDRSGSCEGEPSSKYWKLMPDYLKGVGFKPYYAHIFVPDSKVRTIRSARRFNTRNRVPALFIDQLLGITHYLHAATVMLSVFRIWVAHSKTATSNTNDVECIRNLRDDELARSLFGTIGASHLLYNLAFQRLAKLSNEAGIRRLIYICEFQGWESLLIKHFRSHSILTIGYCHSTLRLLDLRGYIAKSDVPSKVCSERPDTLAVHSTRDRDLLKNRSGKAIVAIVESTRYKDISQLPDARRSKGVEKIIVVGGYSKAETRYLIGVCDNLVTQSTNEISLNFLSHPNATAFPVNFPTIDRDPSRDFISVISDYSAAVVAPETSGAMEAYLLGLPIVVVARPGRFIASPVLGLEGVKVAQSPAELSKYLSGAPVSPSKAHMDKLKPIEAHGARFILWSKLLKGRL